MSAVGEAVRLPNWEMALSAFMQENQWRTFKWGEWDCILFATAAAKVITGEDRGADYRGRYSDQKGARQALRDIGKGTLLRTVDANFVRKPVGNAQRGDLVWRDGCVGICLGSTAAFLTDDKLLEIAGAPRLGNFLLLPRRFWQKAWAV
ncbi:hypothetical protein INR77_08820 [Erythrobacter sp. SCSIO 43205]|uniref:DUF6950 family protein n=1 Tax=Erythrobacter sp. SCSIO 43205 TaxID=2779361 RepID=UPI001CA7D02E|nr:hypothetical protein [Erythrobacter sp. SCSIO 43205]UAB76949.1 hypothetical protein INR77_08820 [Erythrobacter sp. SCSIO 43205]